MAFTKEQENACIKMGLTPEEIEDMKKWDDEVDHGGDPAPLTAEQKKAVKQATNTTSAKKAPTIYKFEGQGKKTKPNELKEHIVAMLQEFLSNAPEMENVTVTNKNRQVAFNVGEKKFELTLVEKRK